MPDEPTEPTQQKTQPRPRKEGKPMPEPVEIPVPSKDQIMDDFEKIVTASVKGEDEDDEATPPL